MAADEEDVWAKATKVADDLYEIRDTFFPQNPDDKTSKLQHESDLALNLLDSIPAEQRKLPARRAAYEYLRGKILDVVPDYRKEAEDHLSKAVKLNPSLGDAWLCLGNCIWKKGDLTSAKNCFNLALSKGPNKKILCQLSMLERRMAQGKGFYSFFFFSLTSGADNQAEMVEESIQHAREAITLDVKDGNSWYNLGNACLTSFFVTGTWDHSKLLQSLKAYQNAEKDERMKSNPDLYFNCATVNKYLENYDRALAGFEAAALKDPSLNASEEVEKMVNLLNKLEILLRGHSKSKRLASLASTIVNSSYKRATLDVLSEGLNKAVAVPGKVLFFVKHENITPLYFLVCNSDQSCFVLSVYGIRNDAIKEGDQLTLLEPHFRNIDFSWKGKCYKFKSIRVDFLEQVLVNGKALPPHQAIRTSIYAQHKP
ncbi:Tetratricopeptide repeat 5 [Gossypium australe]|uniref:Tetratricopeptide repeat 5 n=1 Tax=Gossypium australe TaxID=47621 RepID=A0A5B6V3J6_9ROSI|nr:Tetratricopeptide repeat 5 [Gossypium australe]